MVWKILSGITALCLAVAAYYSFQSRQDTRNELELKVRADKDLASTLTRQSEAAEALTNKEKQLADIKVEITKLKDDLVKVAATVTEKEAALALEKTNLDQVGQQLTSVQKLVDEAGDIKRLIAQVDSLTKEKEKAVADYAAKEAQVAQIKSEVATVKTEIERFRDLEARARRGVVEPNFTARVAQAFGEWGFAVLNKGNNGGVFANADLEVKRGTEVVAKLKVRNVESNISVVDIVPGSVAQGDAIRSGDLVVASAKQASEKPIVTPKPDAAGTTPAPGGAVPAPAPAPGAPADPFAPAMNGGAAPAAPAAPAAADPFAPAAPAPGAAAPAPAMAPDPFAPAATPPAAAGAGTKAMPSTADPFAPAPK